MASLFRALNFKGHHGQPTPLPAKAKASTFYFRKSPFWARWALVLVSVDLILIGGTVAYTWHDYRPAKALAHSKAVAAAAASADSKKDATTTSAKADDTATTADPDAPALTPFQPFWKRAAWSGFHILGGCVAASLILATRSRIVRKVTYLPPARIGSKGPKSKPRIHLETAAHPYGFGIEVPLRDCLLALGKEGDAKLRFRIAGQGYWIAPVQGAKINGEPVPPTLVEAREHILKSWKRIGELGAVPKPAPNPVIQ
ncbi:hypothetical protein M413DRAFT_440334, partial [Hebeloma cylindrosporum]